MPERLSSDEAEFSPTRSGEDRQVPVNVAPLVSVQEFDHLVNTYENGLLRYAYLRLGCQEPAQDIVQEAFLRYLRQARTKFKGPDHCRAWFYKVVHNLCNDHHNSKRRQSKIYKQLESTEVPKFPLAEILSTERWHQLERLLDRLSEKQRSVIILYFFEKRSYKEISETTGLSNSNVGTLLHRGVKKLRNLIDVGSFAEF